MFLLCEAFDVCKKNLRLKKNYSVCPHFPGKTVSGIMWGYVKLANTFQVFFCPDLFGRNPVLPISKIQQGKIAEIN